MLEYAGQLDFRGLKDYQSIAEVPSEQAEFGVLTIQIPTGLRANVLMHTEREVSEEHLNQRWRVECLSSAELTPEMIREFADFYLEIFRNPPYNQFIFHIDDPLTPISPQEAFGMPDKKYFTLEEQESFELPEGYEFWMDREKTLEFTKLRLVEGAFVTRLVNNETGKTEGLVFGRKATLREIFETEEIKDPLLFSTYTDPGLFLSEEVFFHKMKYHFGVKSDTETFYMSCLAIHPSARGFDSLYQLMHNFFVSIPDAVLDLFSFGETEDEGASAGLGLATTERKVFGILNNGHPVAACKHLRYYADHFLASKETLRKVLVAYLKERKKLYKERIENSLKVFVSDEGKRLLARNQIKKGEIITVFTGERYEAHSKKDLPSPIQDHSIKGGKGEYIHADHELAGFMNESFSPNCIIQGDRVIALQDINEGEELTL